ncbi:MAG: hypothetical protein U5R06_04090 [candidate division KSB1 bacterium]|nr:hypothetical protein [candidate division KSB1 bacterium]
MRFQYQFRQGLAQTLYYTGFRMTPKKTDWIKAPDANLLTALLNRLKRVKSLWSNVKPGSRILRTRHNHRGL